MLSKNTTIVRKTWSRRLNVVAIQFATIWNLDYHHYSTFFQKKIKLNSSWFVRFNYEAMNHLINICNVVSYKHSVVLWKSTTINLYIEITKCMLGKHMYVLQKNSSNKAIILCNKLCVKLFSLFDRKVLYVLYLNEAIQLNGSFYMILYATAVLRWCFGIQKHVHNVLKRDITQRIRWIWLCIWQVTLFLFYLRQWWIILMQLLGTWI